MKIKLLFLLFFIIIKSYSQENKYEKYSIFTQTGIKYGIKNLVTNNENIPAIYNDIKEYRDGLFISKKDKLYGLIDSLNNVKIPFKYKEILYLKNDRFLVSDPSFYLTNSNGVKIGNIKFDNVLSYNSDIIQILKDGKIGYLSINGKLILEPKFEKGDMAIKDFIVVHSKTWNSFGYDLVTKDLNNNVIKRQNIGTMGSYPILFNTKGKLLYKGENNETIYFRNQSEYAIAEKYIGNNKTRYIFIDSNGKTKAFFDDLYSIQFHDNYIKFEKISNYNRTWGIINYKGEVVFQPIFKEITQFIYNNDEYAKLLLDDENFFYINKELNCVNFDNKKCPNYN